MTASASGRPRASASGKGNRIELTHELHFPHSLGLLYSAFTYYCGFKVNSGEYKLMGLAPYGEPRYVDAILEHLIDLKEDGSFRMDMSLLQLLPGLTMTNSKFDAVCSVDSAAHARVASSTQAAYGPGCVGAEGHRRGDAANGTPRPAS